jgi:hypothetical protein
MQIVTNFLTTPNFFPIEHINYLEGEGDAEMKWKTSHPHPHPQQKLRLADWADLFFKRYDQSVFERLATD